MHIHVQRRMVDSRRDMATGNGSVFVITHVAEYRPPHHDYPTRTHHTRDRHRSGRISAQADDTEDSLVLGYYRETIE